jgi:Flp pilus assembly protein TadD
VLHRARVAAARPARAMLAARVCALAGALLVVLLAALACGCAAKAKPPAADTAARAQQLIDAGNAAYRQGDYRLAVKRYAAAAVERKDDPAAYYGMGMALGKLGRDEEARAAYQHARDLSQAAGGAAPGSAASAPPAAHP